MSRAPRAIAFLLSCLAMSAWAGAGDRPPASGDALGNAVAGVVIDALSTQLGGAAVDMQMDDFQVEAADAPAMRIVSGTGSVVVAGSSDPIGFSFRVPYDDRRGGAAAAEVELGGVIRGERDLPNDAALVQQLQDQVGAALRRDYHAPDPYLEMHRISTVEAGRRYLRIDIEAEARLGGGNDTPTRIRALYDRIASRWVRMHYDVGAGPDASSLEGPLATR